MCPHLSSSAILQEGELEIPLASVIGGSLGLWPGAPSLAQRVPCEPLRKKKNGIRGGPRNGNFGLMSSEELSFQISRHSPPLPFMAWIFQPLGWSRPRAERRRAAGSSRRCWREVGGSGEGRVWREQKYRGELKPAPTPLQVPRTGFGSSGAWVG